MDHQAAAGWPTAAMAPEFKLKDNQGAPFDPFAGHGADHWYMMETQRVRAIQNDLAQRTFRPGWLRPAEEDGFIGLWRASWMKRLMNSVSTP